MPRAARSRPAARSASVRKVFSRQNVRRARCRDIRRPAHGGKREHFATKSPARTWSGRVTGSRRTCDRDAHRKKKREGNRPSLQAIRGRSLVRRHRAPVTPPTSPSLRDTQTNTTSGPTTLVGRPPQANVNPWSRLTDRCAPTRCRARRRGTPPAPSSAATVPDGGHVPYRHRPRTDKTKWRLPEKDEPNQSLYA